MLSPALIALLTELFALAPELAKDVEALINDFKGKSATQAGQSEAAAVHDATDALAAKLPK